MQKILVIDNFDSFTYNLVQQILSIRKCELIILRNDTKLSNINSGFDKLVISPGPKAPRDAGVSNSLIRKFYRSKPILGVCLGMQCINEVFGGKTVYSPLPYHGKVSKITHSGENIFKNVSQNIDVARYHSLIVANISPKLEIISKTNDNIPMAIKHKEYPVYGVQFHPESFMAEDGNIIINNFLDGN